MNGRTTVLSFTAVTLIVAAIALLGCSSTPTSIQPAASSRSAFDGASFTGQTVKLSEGTPGLEQFRAFSQAEGAFVPVDSVRAEAEKKAGDFCGSKGKMMKPLSETTAKPPYISRVEIVFECGDKPKLAAAPSTQDPRYAKLIDLKKLLDSGILTQEEFNSEKAKILSQP